MEVEKKIERRGGAHRKPTGNVWKHTTMTLKPSQWEAIQKASALCNKNLSRWAVEIVMNYEGVPPKTEVGADEKSQIYPLCFTEVELNAMKAKGEAVGMNRSKYFINVLMDYIGGNK